MKIKIKNNGDGATVTSYSIAKMRADLYFISVSTHEKWFEDYHFYVDNHYGPNGKLEHIVFCFRGEPAGSNTYVELYPDTPSELRLMSDGFLLEVSQRYGRDYILCRRPTEKDNWINRNFNKPRKKRVQSPSTVKK